MGFTPIEAAQQSAQQDATESNRVQPGFTPLKAVQTEAEAPGMFAPAVETIKDIGRVYPVAETAGNLATQAIALPVAGLAGLGAMATEAMGLTETEPADVVHKVASALTYQPQTESGQHLTGAATYPFQKLAEAGRYAGDQTLEATGSPALATAADTAVNALPMAVPGVRAAEVRGKVRTGTPIEGEAPRTAAPTAEQEVQVPKTPAQHFEETIARGKEEARQAAASKVTQPQVSSLVSTESPVPETTTAVRVLGKDLTEMDDALLGKMAGNSLLSVKAREALQDEIARRQTAMDGREAAAPLKGFVPIERVRAEETPGTGRAEQAMVTPRVTHESTMPDGLPAERIADREAGLSKDVETSGLTKPDINDGEIVKPLDEADADIVASPLKEPQAVDAPTVGDALPVDRMAADLNEVLREPRTGFTPEQPTTEAMAAMDASHATMPTETVDSRAAWAPGTNYTGFADSVATAGKLAEKPIRREDVLAPLLKDLGIRVYEGRVSGKRLGFYVPKLGAVRIKNKSDIEVAAHEIAHALDDRIPEIRKSWLSGDKAKTYAEELRGVSYDKAKVFEGFAEFARLYMTQPEKAKAAAPNYYAWFDAFTQRHPNGPAIRRAQEGMTAWFSQDALHRAQSKVGMQRNINEALDGLGDKFRQAVVDDLHGIYRMERDLTGKTSPLGAYETARLTRGAGGLVDGAIRLGAPIRKASGAFDFQGKGLEKILEPVAGNLDEFLMYAVGRSSQELMMQGREKLFSPAEVRAMLQLRRPEFDTAFAEYQAWNSGVLDFAESMGIINKKARSMWQRSQYLPYYRVGQAGASASKGGAQGNWAGIQKLTGGTGNLRDILGNMTQNAATLIDTALKNEARAKIVKLAETQKGGGNFLVKIAPDSKLVKIDRDQVMEKLLEGAGIDPKAARRGMLDGEQAKLVAQIEQQMDSSPGLFEFMVHNQAPRGDILAVLEDGRPTYYEVADPLLYRAVASLNRAPQHWIIRWLGMPKRVGQATITLTPDFAVANIARDTIMGAVMSRAGFRPFVDSVRGMESRIKQDPAYRKYLANGGGFASYLKDENTFRAHLDRFYTSKGINPKTVLDAPDKVMYFVETLADAFEMSTRLGEYKRLREQGVHPRTAAYLGREISTDFAMKGDSQVLGAMYDTVMFLRPAVVSMDRLYRGLAHDPNKGAIAAKAGTIALLSAWLYWKNKENPRYDELDDWDKDSYWHFFVPVDGKEEHFRYPKIWEVGALASVAERSVAALNEQEPEYGKAVGRIMTNLFNLNLMPQVIAPLYEQATNRNGFTNAPIETPGMENLQPFLRAKPTTSETLKAVGMATSDLPESMQVNPARAEALLRGYFNTWAMYGLMLTDEALYGDTLPEKRMDELPVVRRFYEAEPPKHTKYETMFYDMLGEAKRLQGTLRELDRSGKEEIADLKEASPMSGEAKPLGIAADNLAGINRDMNAVRRDAALLPAEKRDQMDALTVERNELLRNAVTDSKTAQAQ